MTGYVLKMFPRFSETFILAEILELERRGREICVMSLNKPDDGRFHADVAEIRAPVRYLPEHVLCAPMAFARAHWRALREAPRRYITVLLRALRYRGEAWSAWLRAPLVAQAAQSAGCERLHAHFASLPAITAMFAGMLAQRPYTFTAHAKDIYLEDRSAPLLRELIARASRVITVSEFNRDYLRRIAGWDLSVEHIVRVYNGVDLETFRAGPRPVSDQAPLILAVGRLVEKKGFADLIRACARLRDRGVAVRVEIVGHGKLRQSLEALIAELDLADRVVLVGALPREGVARRMRQAAMVVAPCVVGHDGNRDGLPTVILEAMAAGVPVVTTDVTGIPEAVEEGVTGRVLPPGHPTVLAAAIEELLRDPALAARMGAAGRRRAEARFDLRRNVLQLDAVLHGREASPGGRRRGEESCAR